MRGPPEEILLLFSGPQPDTVCVDPGAVCVELGAGNGVSAVALERDEQLIGNVDFQFLLMTLHSET